MFPEPRVSGTLRLRGNKIHCFPRDRSLSVFLYLPNSKTEKKTAENRLMTPTVSQEHDLITCESKAQVVNSVPGVLSL